MEMLAFISPFLIGIAIIAASIPEFCSSRAGMILSVCLGTGIGLGITSSTIFAWLALYGLPKGNYFAAEGILAILLGFLAFYRIQHSTSGKLTDPNTDTENNYNTIKWLRNIFIILILISAATFILKAYFHDPHGKWDAWDAWNYRARWLFRGGDLWPHAFISSTASTALDYPLLITASVFRMWNILGSDHVAIPIVIAAIFTFGSILLIFSSLALVRGAKQGYLAAMFMLIATQYLKIGTYQYSDVPLALFILSTIVLLSLKDHYPQMSRRMVFLAGFTASCAAWTKNEGLLFLALVILVYFLGRLGRSQFSELVKDFFSFVLGLVPVLSTLIFFKLNYAPPNDLVSQHNFRQSGVYLFELGRYIQVSAAFIKKIFTFNEYIMLLMAAYFFVFGLYRSEIGKKQILSHIFIILLMLGGYFFSYIISPHPLRWHLNSSLYRLIFQLWPAWVFLFFYYVKAPEKTKEISQT